MNPSLQGDLTLYRTPDMVSFMLSGLIIASLVDMVEPVSPKFFRTAYMIYHNRPMNVWIVAIVRSLETRLFWGPLTFATYFLVATLAFGVQINLLSIGFWIIILLGGIFKLGLNLFTAGWAVVTKNDEDPVSWFYDRTSMLFTGQLVPVGVLWNLRRIGPFLHVVSLIHPKTYVQMVGRQTAVGGASLAEVLPDLWAPLAGAAFFVALGYTMLRICLSRAKREGTLAWG